MNPNWRTRYGSYRTYLMNLLDRYSKRADLKVYTEILLSLLSIIVFSLFAIRPTFKTIASLIGEVENKKQTLTQMNEKIEKLSKAQLLYDQQRKNIQILESGLQNNFKPDEFIGQIEGIAKENDIIVDGIKLGAAQISGNNLKKGKSDSSFTEIVPEGTKSISVNINARIGKEDFSRLGNFVKQLESLRTPVLVGSASFNLSSKNKESEERVEVSIIAVVAYL